MAPFATAPAEPRFPEASAAASNIQAMLGPTNTGKTHRAVERMLEHPTGMIGLPLRLLAREIYDRVTAQVGEAAVALVTGEEKRVPPHPRYWVCTVEAMPSSVEVDFLAVDEVQLAGHAERGHVFTDRMLHWRGRSESWFLGSDTIRPLIERLVPTARIQGRPRLSTLRGVGCLPIGALPPRTAVVAFSAAKVYELAERLRARRGGAAVVLGALSPRARNAQVALYQAGEVDYMVATDAIGMGLNMDIDCVAFADLRKFDGRQTRELEDAELAQIAGRAGRHHNDGRFATLEPLAPLSRATTRALEQHRFPAQRGVYWRNRDLDLGSVEELVASLKRRPSVPWHFPVEDAEDTRALTHLARQPDVAERARHPEQIALLWEVCQIPDFRQLQLDDHFQLLSAVFLQLSGRRARLDTDWIDHHVARLDNVGGDIETLLARMAFIRTWTYITHRAHWVDDATAWQERARAIEDRLSDALHQALVRRFVDTGKRARGRRAERPRATAMSSLAEQLRHKIPEAERAGSTPEPAAADPWVEEVVEATHDRFALDDAGRITFGETPLARLSRGADLLRPEIVLLVPADRLGAGARLRIQRRVLAWTRDMVSALLAPLRPDPERASTLSASARGLLYQLEHHLGTVEARDARAQIALLTSDDRRSLDSLGIRLGRVAVFAPRLLSPAALRRRALLCAAWLGPGTRLDGFSADAASFVPTGDTDQTTCTNLGFPVLAGRAIRADVLEAVVRLAPGGPRADREIALRLGCARDEAAMVREAAARLAGPRRRRRRRPDSGASSPEHH